MSEPQCQESVHKTLGRKREVRFLPALGTVLLVGLSLYASRASVRPAAELGQPSQAGGDAKGDDKATAKAVAAANVFLETLDAPQRDKALLKYDSGKKSAWSNLPVTMVPRNGMRLGDLTNQQRAAALDAVAAVLHAPCESLHGRDTVSIHSLREVCQILGLFKKEKTQEEAAKALGLGSPTISRLLSRLGRTWSLRSMSLTRS